MTLNTQNQTPASDYDFELPRELIAQQPTHHREDARLLVLDRARNQIEHAHFRDLVDWLRPGDCLALNETRVLLAKLVGFRTRTGGRWQGLYLEHEPESGIIKVMCKTRGKIKVGETVTLQDREGLNRDTVTMVARLDDGSWMIKPESSESVDEFLERLGRVPLPHYIRDGNMTDSDVADYQTVYAARNGSVAAPTAGLHFSERLLNQVIDAGVNVCKLTLHVGAGTFRPITTETIESHSMHGERGMIDQNAVDLIRKTRENRGRVIAVGTTTVRLLETAGTIRPLAPWQGTTDLYIRPGHEFQVVDSMITNFHLPRTTLLVMVRSFGGDELVKEGYRQAIEQKYRFFSYGDAMLIV